MKLKNEAFTLNIGKINKISLSEKTAYLAGVIVGDGHLCSSHKSNVTKSKDYKIAIEVIDLNFLREFEKIVKSIIKTKSTIKMRTDNRGNRKNLYYFQFRNKSLYYFLNKDLAIPKGKKSSIVKVSKPIFNSISLQKHFLSGLFDTDGGIRGKTLGFTSASKLLMKDIQTILTNLKIRFYCEKWLNKKYQQNYYGIKIYKRDCDKFLNQLHLKNKEKLEKVFLHVGVPERSNGMDNSII